MQIIKYLQIIESSFFFHNRPVVPDGLSLHIFTMQTVSCNCHKHLLLSRLLDTSLQTFNWAESLRCLADTRERRKEIS